MINAMFTRSRIFLKPHTFFYPDSCGQDLNPFTAKVAKGLKHFVKVYRLSVAKKKGGHCTGAPNVNIVQNHLHMIVKCILVFKR